MSELPILTLEEIRAADDRPLVDVTLPAGGLVRVRGLTRAAFLQCANTESNEEAEALLLANGLAEPPATLEQARELMAQTPSATIGPIVRGILRATGIGSTDTADETETVS